MRSVYSVGPNQSGNIARACPALTWPSPDLHFDGLPPPLPHRPAPSLHFDRLVPGDRASLHFIELARLHGGRSL